MGILSITKPPDSLKPVMQPDGSISLTILFDEWRLRKLNMWAIMTNAIQASGIRAPTEKKFIVSPVKIARLALHLC